MFAKSDTEFCKCMMHQEYIAFNTRQPLVALSIAHSLRHRMIDSWRAVQSRPASCQSFCDGDYIAQRENYIEILSLYSITSIVKNCFKHSDYLDNFLICSAELRESRLAEAEEAMVKSKQKMQQDAKQNMLDTYSMKYSASSKSESYHESSVTTTTTE